MTPRSVALPVLDAAVCCAPPAREPLAADPAQYLAPVCCAPADDVGLLDREKRGVRTCCSLVLGARDALAGLLATSGSAS